MPSLVVYRMMPNYQKRWKIWVEDGIVLYGMTALAEKRLQT